MNTQTENDLKLKDDFYMWQNASWMKNNPIPDEYSTWGSFMTLRDESLKAQISLLEELKKKKVKDHNETLLARIYDSNMSLLRGWDEGKGNYNPIKKELENLDAFVDFNEPHHSFLSKLAEYGAYCGVSGVGFVINFDKGEDLTDSQNIKLDVAGGSTSLPDRDYYFEDAFKKERCQFLDHLQNLVTLMETQNIKLESNFVNKVLSFETKLAKMSMKNDQARLYDEYFNKTDLNKFWDNINDMKFVAAKLNNFDESERDVKLNDTDIANVKLFMSKMYSGMGIEKVMFDNYIKNYGEYNEQDAKTLCVYDGDYFVRLFKLLTTDDNEMRSELKAYLQYQIVQSACAYCTKDLYEEFFDFYNRKLSGVKVPLSHEKRTISKINGWVGEALGSIYVKKYFNEDSKTDLEGMINVILGEMNKSLETNDWLTKDTKVKALRKLSTFNMKIGYPVKFKDYSELNFCETDSTYDMVKKVQKFNYKGEFLNKINSKVDKEKWGMTPQTVNAYYNPLLNEVVFPAAILQPPFYQSTVELIDMKLNDNETEKELGFDPLRVVNYGSISTVISHEITHGYDDMGKKFDADGNMINWWTDEDVKLFESKTQLMADQAELYTFENEGVVHSMKPQLTMGENLADLAGMTLALRAMLSESQFLTSDGKPKKEALRLFFRAFGNMWRQNTTVASRIERLATDPHGPADFRANLVKNIDEFYEAWDVVEGDKMYIPPSKRVRVW